MDKAFFDNYQNVLASRFSEEAFTNNELSEDCIRYDFFEIYIKHFNLTSTDLILEYPFRHASDRFRNDDNFSKKNLDCASKKKKSCFEFKFFRQVNDANYNYDVTAAGALAINDIYRLHYSNEFNHKYFILISSQKMINHLNTNSFNFGIGKYYKRKLLISSKAIFQKNLQTTFSKKFKFENKDVCDIYLERIYDKQIVKKEVIVNATTKSGKPKTQKKLFYFRLIAYKVI